MSVTSQLGKGLIELSLTGAGAASALLGKMKKDLSGLADVASKVNLGAKIAFASLTGAIGLGIKEAADAESTFMRLKSVIEAGGNVIGFSAEQLRDYADALQTTTRFSGGAIQEAMIILATFQQIRGPIMKGAVDALADMAVIMGGDVADAARTLGKALSEPATAVETLRRAQVVFTDDEAKQLEQLLQHNKAMEAQQFILDKLAKSYGGAAAKDMQTFAGQFHRVKNAMTSMIETVGTALLPGLTLLADRLGTLVPRMSAVMSQNSALMLKIIGITGAVLGLVAVLPQVLASLSAVGTVLGAILSPAGAVIAVLGGIGYALIQTLGEGDTFGQRFLSIFSQIGESMTALLEHVTGISGGWMEAFALMESGMRSFASTAAFVALDVVDSFAAMYEALESTIRPKTTKFFTTLMTAADFAISGRGEKGQQIGWADAWAEAEKAVSDRNIIREEDFRSGVGGGQTAVQQLRDRIAEKQQQLAEMIFPDGAMDSPWTNIAADFAGKLKDRVSEVAKQVADAWGTFTTPEAPDLKPGSNIKPPTLPNLTKTAGSGTAGLVEMAKSLQVAAFRSGPDPQERTAQAAEKNNELVAKSNDLLMQMVTAITVGGGMNRGGAPAVPRLG